jgi:pre-mRNA-splicing factor CWC22
MLIECCAQERTFLRYFGLVAARFCMIHSKYQAAFSEAFRAQYAAAHRLETNPLRNTAKFFSHLLHTDALPWTVLEFVRLNEDETTPSSRIFVKVMFQELVEYMGLGKLRSRLEDAALEVVMGGIFPRDNLRDTRFAINFFTSIGLGGLTDNLRAFLKQQAAAATAAVAAAAEM